MEDEILSEEIEWYKKHRETFFWEGIWGKLTVIILLIGLLFAAGCSSTSPIPTTTGIPEPYNLIAMGNSTGYVQLVQLVNNELMGGYFGDMILVAVFVMSFMAFLVTTNHPSKAFATSSFIALTLSFLLRSLNLIPDATIYILLGITAVAVIALIPRD